MGADVVFGACYDVPGALFPPLNGHFFAVLIGIDMGVVAVGGEIVFVSRGTFKIEGIVLGDGVPTHDAIYELMRRAGRFLTLVSGEEALFSLIQVDEPSVSPGRFENV